MTYPPAVCAKAQRLETVLQRLALGEDLAALNAELGLSLIARDITRLQDKYTAGGQTWEALLDGRYGHSQKAHSAVREWLYERRRQDDTVTGAQLVTEIWQQFQVDLSLGHVNSLVRQAHLARPPGRPPSAPAQPASPGLLTPTETPEPAAPHPEPLANAGLFFLEGAKQDLGVVNPMEECLQRACQREAETRPPSPLRLTQSEPETVWHKFDHLLYLPVLGLTRPRDLYYYQGPGLRGLYGFTYKYHTLEHFLGHLTRIQLGYPLARVLARCYSQAWHPGPDPLFILTDWHVKPHWTKPAAHSGHISMWGRTMPGTKQLFINSLVGHLLGAWNYAVDTHLSRVLVDLEADLATQLERPIACNIFDSEGSGRPTAHRYTAAARAYISVLPRQERHTLDAFCLQGAWQVVVEDPTHEAVYATWQDPREVAADPRQLVLMRPLHHTDPSRVYAGRIPADVLAAQVPYLHRRRWEGQEKVIRQVVNGANGNANYGYAYSEVPDRTQQRRWQAAQEQVESHERRLAETQAALADVRRQLTARRQTHATQQAALRTALAAQEQTLAERHAAGQPTRRCTQRIQRLGQQLAQNECRFQRQRRRLIEHLCRRRTLRTRLRQELSVRQAQRDAIDTTTLCRERDLEKDQIMLDLQGLLFNLHDWARTHYFAPAWQRLELDTATEMIYRKPGWVYWSAEQIEVVLEAYRYPEQQRAMEESCRRFNQAQLHWRDGRLLRIRVASP